MGLGLTYTVLQKYAATQKMTGNEQARSGHFCLCGYGAVRPALLPAASAGFGQQSKDCSPQSRYARRYYAPLTSASRRHFWSGVARKFDKHPSQVWGRSAQQAENRAAIPKKTDSWLIELARIRQLSAFSWPQTTLCSPHRLNWRKLPESVSKPIRPLESRGRRPLAQVLGPRRP